VLTSKSQPEKMMAPNSHKPTTMTSEQNREQLRKKIQLEKNRENYRKIETYICQTNEVVFVIGL
jgi:hypothetical protein